MKEQANAMYRVGTPMIKGEKPYDQAAATDVFKTIVATAAKLKPLWPDDSQAGDHRSLPGIWKNKKRFQRLDRPDGEGTRPRSDPQSRMQLVFKAAFDKVNASCNGLPQGLPQAAREEVTTGRLPHFGGARWESGAPSLLCGDGVCEFVVGRWLSIEMTVGMMRSFHARSHRVARARASRRCWRGGVLGADAARSVAGNAARATNRQTSRTARRCSTSAAARPAMRHRRAARPPMTGSLLGGGACYEHPVRHLQGSPTSRPIRNSAWADGARSNSSTPLQRGVGRAGEHLYPAFPYTSYQRMRLDDVRDLFAYLKDSAGGRHPRPEPHQLPFPFNIRRGLGLWKLLNLDGKPFETSPARSAMLKPRRPISSRDPGTAASCHTPRNILGGTDYSRKTRRRTQSGRRGLHSPTSTPHADGLAKWSDKDIAYLLETGQTPDADSRRWQHGGCRRQYGVADDGGPQRDGRLSQIGATVAGQRPRNSRPVIQRDWGDHGTTAEKSRPRAAGDR